MKPPCELIVREILPISRAKIAKLLVNEYKWKQEDVADILGIKQSTVSRYISCNRGDNEEVLTFFPEIQKYIETIVAEIHSKKSNETSPFCDLCSEIRDKKEFCDLHKEHFNLSECNICFGKQSHCF